MNNPFIIMSAPNGARRQKKDHPEIPISPDDMAICAEQILSEGASILHLHVRDEQNQHSLDVDRYKASIKAIRDTVGKNLIIQATTEAVGIYNRHQQMDMVKTLRPEATSIALRELCPDEKNVTEFADFIIWMKKESISPQFILYDDQDYQHFEDYKKRGIFHDDDPFILFVFGSYQGQSADTDRSTALLKEKSLTAQIPWAVCGFAENEKECVSHAAKNNGHIRVGFENNIWKDGDLLLENNAEMIKYSAKVAHEQHRLIANASTVRNIFNLRD